MPTKQLLHLATELSIAADKEEWEQVATLLHQFNKLATSIQYSRADKATLSDALAKLNSAVASTTRRKDEIRDLLNTLSSAPI